MNAINVIFQWKMNIMILNGIYRFDFMFKVEFKYRPFIILTKKEIFVY